MGNADTSEYLAAEAEATRLVDELRSLRQEVGSYKTAHAALGVAAEELGRVADKLSQLAEATAQNVGTLREIGVPELRDAQRKQLEQLSSLRQTTTAHGDAVTRLRTMLFRTAIGIAVGMLLIVVLLVRG